MPAADTQQRRAGLPLVPGLLWAGVGLAPVAALLVVFSGDSTALVRVAVLLAVVAVVLIGVSMALRRDPEVVRDQVEDMIFEELDVLRDDLRDDIKTAAKATHKALGDRVVNLHESVEALRGQVDNLRVRVERGPAPAQSAGQPARSVPPPVGSVPPPNVVSSHGVVRHTETVKVTRQTIVDQNDGGRGTVYGSSRGAEPPPIPAQRRSSSADDEGESWTEQLLRERLGEDRLSDSGFNGGFGADRRDEPRYGLSGSESRYGSDDRYSSDGLYGSTTRYGSDDRSGAEERYGSDDPSGANGYGADDRGGRRRAPEPEHADGDRITGVRASDRWASVRGDDRSREYRMGERRAAMQSDESGTEVRIEDRWAAVRREEGRRAEPRREPDRDRDRDRSRDLGRDAGRGSDWSREIQRDRDADWSREGGGRTDSGSWAESRLEELRAEEAGRRRDRRGGQPALPATSSEPSASSWVDGWSARPEPISERIRRSRDDDGYRWTSDDDGPHRSARARSTEYGTGEDRWR
jgi:hypothetical protein